MTFDAYRLLGNIYDLTRKGKQFLWEEEQQKAFDEIKCRPQRPPVLHLPDRHGCFQLYSDTSKFATGSALYQIKLKSQGSLHMPVKECQRQQRTIPLQNYKCVD